jgi:hypothetical protein
VYTSVFIRYGDISLLGNNPKHMHEEVKCKIHTSILVKYGE